MTYVSKLDFKDENLIIWALGDGITRFIRSSMGPQLEWAEKYHIRLPRLAWNEIAPEYMTVKEESWASSTDVPNHKELTAFAIVTRWMDRLYKAHKNSWIAANLYYGDKGCYWARQKEGRDISLYPMTVTGRKILKKDVELHPGAADRDDLFIRLNNIIEISKMAPSDDLISSVRKMREESREIRLRMVFELKKVIEECHGSAKVQRQL